MYSTNGTKWREGTSNDGLSIIYMWSSVCYGFVNGIGLFVAVGSTGPRVMTSADGIKWKSLSNPAPFEMQRGWASVCYGNGLFVAVASNGSSNIAMTSTNGSAWNVGSETFIGRSVCYGNNLFVALPSGTRSIRTSVNGINWTNPVPAINPNINATWASVCGGDGMFVAVASSTSVTSSARIITSGVISCYYKTSEIICFIDNEEKYICIKDIKINYLVKTYKHGYKKVSLIGKKSCFIYPNNQDTNCLYKIKNGSLILSGGHYLLVDELPDNLTHQFYSQNIMIDDKKILLTCDSDNFEKINETIYTELYHLVLESDSDEQQYGIYANNILTESCSKKHFISTGFY